MYNRNILKQSAIDILENSTKGHDIEHMEMVYNLSQRINKGEEFPADDDILYAASWLHDLGHTIYDPEDPSYSKHPEKSVDIARDILEDVGFPMDKRLLTLKAILLHDDRKPWGTHKSVDEIEVKIIQDADNLEALGERGVKRIIAYCETVHMPYFNPSLKWNDSEAKSQSILHNIYAHMEIYNKLHTNTAKILGKSKIHQHYYMLKQLIEKHNNLCEDKRGIADTIPPLPCDIS
ncbi:HD domain-containing protein [Candidatus Woesearchaeota archaeon]|nr:HD domain-containing protein [Candidatus Woesearchaeota archaeon]